MISIVLVCCFLVSIQTTRGQNGTFIRIDPVESGVLFTNPIVETDSFNVLRDFYAYNGGGVGVGDLDNDGLLDLIFTGTQSGLAVYKNLGNLKFKDVTRDVGMFVKDGAINNGVTVADLTGDGWLDVFISRRYTRNLFFVNNGNGTFTERGLQTGIGLEGNSTTIAAVLDYNRDGFPDLFMVKNGEPRRQGYLNAGQNDELYRNNGDGTWTDVTKQAGIIDKGYGLSASVGDVNNDGWPDIYVANDFEERDKLWINNGDGTFQDVASTKLQNMSWASMGSDIADVNNDGLLDILSVDMFPRSHYRRMSQLGGMSIYGPFFDSLQRVHNTLQINRGNGYFTNTCYLSGMAATDWSWSVLAADYNNDGLTDIFVSNGVKRDIGDQDILNNLHKPTQEINSSTFQKMPTSRGQNYLFMGRGDYAFDDRAMERGLTDSVITNGACYADLDNDGDLDLVLNNTDTVAFVYQNLTIENQTPNSNFVRIELQSTEHPHSGVGSRVTVYAGGKKWVKEYQIVRGFHGTSDPVVHVGLGAISTIDSVVVQWTDGSTQVEHPLVNTTSLLKKSTAWNTVEAKSVGGGSLPQTSQFMQLLPNAFPYFYKENLIDDFKRERLLPYRFSDWGPRFAWRNSTSSTGADIVLTGPKYSTSAYYSFNTDSFESTGQLWKKTIDLNENESEHVTAVFIDVNVDGVNDLYMVSGGNEFDFADKELLDVALICDKKNSMHFTRADALIPRGRNSGSCVAASDFDADGDQDLFVGSRVVPGQFPQIPRSVLLKNVKGKLTDVTDAIAPGLSSAGMITSAVWIDYDADGDQDLLVAGEWMTPRLWRNTKGRFDEVTSEVGLNNLEGWWLTMRIADVNSDGKPDVVIGNVGMNCRYVPEPGKPLELFNDDFDDNGSMDPIITFYDGEVQRPLRGKNVLAQHMPYVNRKYPHYKEYALASIDSLITPLQKAKAQHLLARRFESGILVNTGGKFTFKPLPAIAQVSPVYAIVWHDVDHDGKPDLILAGNNRSADADAIALDAGIGCVLKGDGKGNFSEIPPAVTGFVATQSVRQMDVLPFTEKADILFVSCNNDRPLVFLLPKK